MVIVKIRRSYMEKGSLIGKGKTAEVYEYGPDRVLKLFLNNISNERAIYEARIGKTINEAGVPSPQVYDIVQIDNRKGIILQRIYGKTLLRLIQEKPWKLCHYAKQMARLQYKIHNYSITDILPSQNERFSRKIKNSFNILGEKGKRIWNYINSLQDGNSICHGDIHFKNIIISDNGPVAIDWNSGYKGNPLGDVARTYLTLNLPPNSSIISNINKILPDYPRELISLTYLDEYMKLANVKLEDIDAWILPVAAARLKDHRPLEHKWLMDIIDTHLKKYNV